MLRSLYSGVSGMKNFQTKMDVIANNIANVNTTAFKSGSVRFQDMLSQTTSSAQSPMENGLGGVNSKQVGLGVKLGSIDTIMTGGALQPTNRELDFAIEGEGFFNVSDGKQTFYTRDGAFYTDYEGNLVTSSGLRVLGVRADGSGEGDELEPVEIDGDLEALEVDEDGGNLSSLRIPGYAGDEDNTLQSFTVDGTGQIIGIYADGERYHIGQVAITSFKNPEGLAKTGSNNYIDTNNSGTPQYGMAGDAGKGIMRQGFIEMSNVDLANEFTDMIITSRAFQANSRSITTSDEMLQELINLKR